MNLPALSFAWGLLAVLGSPTSDRPVALEGHKHTVTCVAFAPGGTCLASGAKDGAVILWDIPNRAQRATSVWISREHEGNTPRRGRYG